MGPNDARDRAGFLRFPPREPTIPGARVIVAAPPRRRLMEVVNKTNNQNPTTIGSTKPPDWYVVGGTWPSGGLCRVRIVDDRFRSVGKRYRFWEEDRKKMAANAHELELRSEPSKKPRSTGSPFDDDQASRRV
ncbi:transcriptional regulator [Anopheles sinensis]|uniref:Transcriptional regulator n=1 Tax=Anopheles sinensis TaxID=74873 RepID=A0A084W2Q4_ANOSI|nr:transcriptional regulator [Anopheles sinensis]